MLSSSGFDKWAGEYEFYCWDFKRGLPEELKTLKFDYMIFSYAIHHLSFGRHNP